MRWIQPLLAAVCLACAVIRPAHAQTAADSASLAREMAGVVADSIVAQVADMVVWRSFDNPFDAAVAENLRSFPAVSRPTANPRHAIHIGIRSVAFEADTARVLVEMSQQYADEGSLTFYIQRDEYVFQRTTDGWRYLYPRQISIADGGPVRGR
jgi:hypothetical protein